MKIKSSKRRMRSAFSHFVSPELVGDMRLAATLESIGALPEVGGPAEDRAALLCTLRDKGGTATLKKIGAMTGRKDFRQLARTIKESAVDGLLDLDGDEVRLTPLGHRAASLL